MGLYSKRFKEAFTVKFFANVTTFSVLLVLDVLIELKIKILYYLEKLLKTSRHFNFSSSVFYDVLNSGVVLIECFCFRYVSHKELSFVRKGWMCK